MKKTSLIFIFTLLLTILSACASADLSYTLSDDNKVNIHYQLAFEEPELDMSAYLDDIGSYWADQGMSIYADKEANTLTGEKSQTFDSAKEAADAFSSIFALQDSIFSNVDFSYTPSFSLDTYSLSADVSLADIIRQSESQSMPADQITALENSAKQGEYTISVTLPGDVIETNADSREGSACTWNLNYGETRTLTLETQKKNTENIQRYNDLESMAKRNSALLIICAVIAGLCILTIVVSVIVRRIKRKRASEVRIKHFR
jgi:hypothetical protein